MEQSQIKKIVEAALMAVDKPLNLVQLHRLFRGEDEKVERSDVNKAIIDLQEEYESRGVSVVEVASGYRVQIDQDVSPWISRLFEEKPPRYTRALLETLALIAYRQPITRSEIEEVRGVSVSTNIIKTLLEREWVQVVGHKEVPGRPAMYATTKEFLDYFNLRRIDELPPLSELTDLDKITIDTQLEMSIPRSEEEVADDDPESELVAAEIPEESEPAPGNITLH